MSRRKPIAGCKEIRDYLSPDWLRDCVMIDRDHSAIVISPTHCLEHGITNLVITQNRFCGKTILRFRLDFDVIKVKKGQPIDSTHTVEG